LPFELRKQDFRVIKESSVTARGKINLVYIPSSFKS
jgi:hypothetical protein